jgi:anhydro-N-acetylmuramic acid kinase
VQASRRVLHNNLGMSELFIGLMSGTSLDGVDGVLVDFAGDAVRILAHAYAPFPTTLRAELLELNTSGADEIHRSALAANALVVQYAQVVSQLQARSGCASQDVAAIGAHGQTVRHRPQMFGGTGYTVQLNNAALLAELTGINVVADFRSRDVAAGGQGAPLVPAFHREMFGRAHEAVAVLNIGGIGNVTLLPDQSGEEADEILGFDCGPGNALMDDWCQKHRGLPFDRGGQWAASGTVHGPLLQRMLAEPYFGQAPPKSTGRDLFNASWLQACLAGLDTLLPVDVQATLAELTVICCSDCINSYQKYSKLLIVCGGGALNTHVMRGLQRCLDSIKVVTSDVLGVPPLQVEAAAFAWLARKALLREPAGLPRVTGAKKGTPEGARILGAIYPR